MGSHKQGGEQTNISTSASFGCPMSMPLAESAVGSLAISRFTGIVDSDVVLWKGCEWRAHQHGINKYSRRSRYIYPQS